MFIFFLELIRHHYNLQTDSKFNKVWSACRTSINQCGNDKKRDDAKDKGATGGPEDDIDDIDDENNGDDRD